MAEGSKIAITGPVQFRDTNLLRSFVRYPRNFLNHIRAKLGAAGVQAFLK